MTADDARHRTKVWMESRMLDANLTDDAENEVYWKVAYGFPSYPLTRVFGYPKNVDLIYSILDPTSEPRFNTDKTIIGYTETVPIRISCIDKQSITASKLKWTAERELRRICETYPFGSLRLMDARKETTERQGVTVIYGLELTITYVRDTT